MDFIYGKNINSISNYSYSSVDDSSISNSGFGLSEDEDLINENIKNTKVLYIKKSKAKK